VRADDRPSVIARLDGLSGGLRSVSRTAVFELPEDGVSRAAVLSLSQCAPSGAPLEASALSRRAELAFAAERLAVIRTGAEPSGGAQLVALSTQAGLRASFVGTGALPADRLEPQSLSGANALVQQLSSFDVDGDCADDLLVLADGRTPEVWPSDVAGVPAADPSRIAAVAAARAAALGDVDRDGYADVVTVGGEGASVLISDRARGYVESPDRFSVQPTDGRAVALGDLDGDGRLDLLVGFSSGPLRWWRDDGAGGFALNAAPIGAGFDVTAILLRDLDSDGDLDAIVATRDAQPGLRLFFNDDAGGFEDRTATLVPADVDEDVIGLLLADLDDDCVDELVVLGTSQPPRLFGLDSSGFLDDRGSIGSTAMRAAAAGDLDGDGIVELLLGDGTRATAWSRAPRTTP